MPRLAILAAAACAALLIVAFGVRIVSRLLSNRRQDEPPLAEQPLAENDSRRSNRLVDPALAAQLDKEMGIAGLRLRPPRGFTLFPVRQQPRWLPRDASFVGISWMQTPERKALLVASEVKYATAEANGSDLPAALERFYDRLQQHVRATKFSADPPKLGRVGDDEFIMAAFSGMLRFDQEMPRAKRAGQVLIRLQGASELTVYYFCDADGSRELFRQLEATLLTVRVIDTGPAPQALAPIGMREEDRELGRSF